MAPYRQVGVPLAGGRPLGGGGDGGAYQWREAIHEDLRR